MLNIHPMTALYTGAQSYFSRAQNAWEAACAVWNEASSVQTTRLQIQSIEHAEWEEDPDATRPSIPSSEIIISNRHEAIERAQCALAEPISASKLVLWTDASVTRIGAGWAVSFWDGLNWVRITARLTVRGPQRKLDSNIAEVQAISLAFDYAVQFVERKTKDETPLQILEVYTDCQGALTLLRHRMRSAPNPSNLPKKLVHSGMIVRDTILKIKNLQEAGVNIELHWVPRNTTLGNTLADKGAGLARLTKDGSYTLSNALVELMPSHTDKYRWNSGQLPLAHTHEFIHQSCMAEHIASILGNREIKSLEDESIEDTPEETPGEVLEDSPENSLGESLEDSPEKSPEGTPTGTPAETPFYHLWESPEESQDPNLNLDLLYDAPVVEVDMKEAIPIDPDLLQLYGESL